MLRFREVAAVRARVARHFMRLVERLARVEGFLGGVAKQAARLDLDVGKGVCLGLERLLVLRLAGDDGGRRFAREAIDELAANVEVNEELSFFVHPPLPRRWPPAGRKTRSLRFEGRGQGEIGLRLEMRNSVVSAGHHGEGRGLDSTDGDELAFACGRLVGERIGAGKVHAKQPVRARAPTGGIPHAGVLAVVAKVLKSLSDRRRIDGGHPEALHRLFGLEVLDHLVHEKLALAVWVSGINEGVGRLDKFPDDGKLLLDALVGLGERDPFLRKDRQVYHAPHLRAFLRLRDGIGEIDVRLGLFQQVPEAPRDDVAVRAVDARARGVDDAQLGGNGLGDRGFLSNEKAHRKGPKRKRRRSGAG